MAENSEGKKPKPDILSLFRMDFYKKQKNWKLCKDEKDKTPPKTPEKEKNKLILNEDNIHMKPESEFKVEPELEPSGEGEGDQRGDSDQLELNQDIHNGNGRNRQDCAPPITISSQMWINSAYKNGQQDLNEDHQIYSKSLPDNIWNYAMQECPQSSMYMRQALTELEYDVSNSEWPNPALKNMRRERSLTDTLDLYSEVSPQIVELDCDWEEQCSHGEPLKRYCQEYGLWPTPTPIFHMTRSIGSVESLSKFMEGAAAAPHSSEKDLATKEAHHNKRTASKREARDEYPLRDVVPLNGTHEFIAGSFMHVVEGRGRGRLQGERVICIKNGRPYRV